MSFVFIIIGAVLVIAGVRDKEAELFTLVKGDFEQAFALLLAILVIGAIGYVPDLKTFSRAFMALIIIGFFLAKHGATGTDFFNRIKADFVSKPAGTAAVSSGAIGSLPSIPPI